MEFSMSFKNKKVVCALFFVLSFLWLTTEWGRQTKAFAFSEDLIEVWKLQGVNRIVFQENYGPKAPEVLGVSSQEFVPVIQEFLNDTFSVKNKEVKIVPSSQVIGERQRDTQDLFLEVILSARQENKGTQKVASLYVQISREDQVISAPLVSYPFSVPADKQELKKRIRQGMHYLIAYLPDLLACANNETLCDGYTQPYEEAP